MSTEQFLSRAAFDDIIASLEALLLEVQNLVASVDPLNDPGVIADIQELADNLALLTTIATNLPSIMSVEEALPAINAVNGALTAIQSVADALADVTTVAGIEGQVTAVAGIESEVVDVAGNLATINTLVASIQYVIDVAGQLGNIQIVAENDEDITTVAGAIVAVQEVAANIQDVINAVQAAEDAEQARDDAQTWAEGDDPDVELLGGTHSAKTWAEISEQHTREGIRFLGTVADLDDLPTNPDDGDAYFYAETVGDNVIGYGVVWSESEEEWVIFQMGATLIPGTMLPDQEAAPAAANQTTFGGFSANPAMSLVMINRIEQESDTYTFDGNQIVFSEGLSAGDIVRVRQWRTQVSFEDLPEIDQLTQEDKIPVQTSQGAGVVDFPELIFQRQKLVYTKDFMPFECQETVSGSASIMQDISGTNYLKQMRTGGTAGSTATLQNPLRHGLFRLPEVNGRQRINFNNRIQFIQHIGLLGWADGCEYTFSFGRTFNAGNDSGEHMFGFTIKGVEPMLYLTANDGSTGVAEVQGDVVPEGAGFYLSTICMDFYPGEAFVLTLNGVEYEITDQLPTGIRVNTIPGVWTVTNGTSTEDARFEIYRNEISVIP